MQAAISGRYFIDSEGYRRALGQLELVRNIEFNIKAKVLRTKEQATILFKKITKLREPAWDITYRIGRLIGKRI